MDEIKNFIAENRIVLLCCVVLLLLICWLHHDANRNDKDYNNTDNTVAELNQRIDALESRLAGMSERIEQTQKTVNGIAVRVSTSTGYAIEINEGVGRAEERLESAIQRSERIKEIIADIENADRKGTKNP